MGNVVPEHRDRGADVLPFPKRGVVRDDNDTAPRQPDVPRLRDLIGDTLRDERVRQDRTLADVARDAAVSLPYLSEVERGRKEISSDLLHAVSGALDLTLAEVLDRCVERLADLQLGAQRDSGIQLRAA